jgi:diadenosine tetraphosphate (Ap4A) HIT family hydrolase
MRDRTFYDDGEWFACLASPANMRGHAILARVQHSDECPTQLMVAALAGVHVALARVAGTLQTYYGAQHLLLASLRVKDPHIHIHVFPVTHDHEMSWREQKGSGYESGRFFEFLGDQEREPELVTHLSVSRKRGRRINKVSTPPHAER